MIKHNKSVAMLLFFCLISCLSTVAQIKPDTFFGVSANDLVNQCRRIDMEAADEGKTIDLMECMGYITGFIDGASLIAKGDPSVFHVCIPTAVTKGQLIRVVLKYAEDHPENLHWIAANFVSAALMRSFPCGTGHPG